MFKRIFALFISLFTLATFIGCNDTNVEPLSDEEKAALVSNSFSPDTFFNVKEGEDLTNEEIRDVVSNIPSEKYESYPDIHNIPLLQHSTRTGNLYYWRETIPDLSGS